MADDSSLLKTSIDEKLFHINSEYSSDAMSRLRASEEILRLFVEYAPAAIAMFDREMRYLAASRRYYTDYAISEPDIIGCCHYDIFPEMPEHWKKIHARCLAGACEMADAEPFPRQNGETDWVSWEIRPWYDSHGTIGGLILFSEVITARKRVEDALQRSNLALQQQQQQNRSIMHELSASENKYRTLFESANEGILIVDPASRKIQFANPACSRMLGYSPEELTKLHLFDLKAENLNSSDDMCLLRKDQTCISVVINSARAEIDGLQVQIAFITDITERKAVVEERAESGRNLLAAMKKTVELIARTVELRDPYTAGHQDRVMALADAIATEMNMPAYEVEGIHLAAIVHDLGKIYVPAEILSKPGRLSEIEFKFIKSHAQAGYDILKDVELPWPIARMVQQHHERVNGSGYPLGLAGSDILPGARILAVADVVEAMLSHRPYRPARTIGEALDEIRNNRGELYDEQVVDACLRIFSQGFAFEKTGSR